MKNRFFVVILLLFAIAKSPAQIDTQYHRVEVVNKNGIKLEYASILFKGSADGTISN